MNSNENLFPSTLASRLAPFSLEEHILTHIPIIEHWFKEKWQNTPPPLTSSVDLRPAGFKLSPVDTNLFPAGFNNLNPHFFTSSITAIKAVMTEYMSHCRKIVIVPENHTRSAFYMQSLQVLYTLLDKSGYQVRIGSTDEGLTVGREVRLENGNSLFIEPLRKHNGILSLEDFVPDLIILNNDLSSGLPVLLEHIKQPVLPKRGLGWAWRLKSTHFRYFAEIAAEFADLLSFDPWFINPYFSTIGALDFMTQEGIGELKGEIARILSLIREKYKQYHIRQKPFVVVKADNGTYGMSVMTIHSSEEIEALNRKQRTKMSAVKGSRKVDRVIIQEGVYTVTKSSTGAIAEPVIYMIGPSIVGGFYRIHDNKRDDENLNAPGMRFEPFSVDVSALTATTSKENEHFYIYSVVARLAALAAGQESQALEAGL